MPSLPATRLNQQQSCACPTTAASFSALAQRAVPFLQARNTPTSVTLSQTSPQLSQPLDQPQAAHALTAYARIVAPSPQACIGEYGAPACSVYGGRLLQLDVADPDSPFWRLWPPGNLTAAERHVVAVLQNSIYGAQRLFASSHLSRLVLRAALFLRENPT